MDGASEVVNGTVVAHGEKAALIRGPSGSGKSDLALRCMVHALSVLIPGPVRLVADDYVQVSAHGSCLMVRAPDTIANKIEVRGLGVIDVEALGAARLALVVDLVASDLIERLPLPQPMTEFLGVSLPLLRLDAFESAAASKLLIALVCAT